MLPLLIIVSDIIIYFLISNCLCERCPCKSKLLIKSSVCTFSFLSGQDKVRDRGLTRWIASPLQSPAACITQTDHPKHPESQNILKEYLIL